MSRSGYSDDCDGPELNLWRGAVNAAIKGKRGQAFLREALVVLDAMPVKELITDSLNEPEKGAYCVLGAVGAARGMDLAPLEDTEPRHIAKAFGISLALASEIMWENDAEWSNTLTPEHRWSRMRGWIDGNITKETS